MAKQGLIPSPPAASHSHHKVYIPSCKECVEEDDIETQRIISGEFQSEGGLGISNGKTIVPIKGGYAEVDADEVVSNLLRNHINEFH